MKLRRLTGSSKRPHRVFGKVMRYGADYALLHILSAEADTNMIARSSLETAEEIRGAIRELLQETPFPDRNTLEALDLRFRELNLSPGGSADLLAICYLLHFMKTETLV